MKRYDIVFIGGGPGGYVGSIKASQLGLKTALIEKSNVGGTCLMRGCIPTKTLIANANVMHAIKSASLFGITIDGNVRVDYSAMKERKDQVVSGLANGVKSLVKSHGVDLLEGEASFVSKNEVKIKGKETSLIEANSIVVATGSESMPIPSCPVDQHRIHDSTSILELTELPKSLIVLGGGYIGCEFASLFNMLGTKVTIVEALPGIVLTQGETISQFLQKSFTKRGIDLRCGVMLEKSEVTNSGVRAHLKDGSSVEAEMLLVSVGRKPFTEGLNLGAAGIAVDQKGFIEVDDYLETSTKGIYAIGDVTGKAMLAHVASHQGITVAETCSGHKTKMEYDKIPAVIFTHPEIATVGLTLEQALEKGWKAASSTFPFSALGKAQAAKEADGFATIIFEKENGRILGGFVVGHEAGILIAELTLAIQNEIPIECIAETIHAHPTLAEVWMEGAHLANKTPLHLPPSMVK